MDSKRCIKYIIGLFTLFSSTTAVCEFPELYYPIVFKEETSSFGERTHPIYRTKKFHEGVDLSASLNSEVHSIATGIVVYAGPLGNYGNTVVIEHAGEITSHYCHLKTIDTSTGSTVSAGETIGVVGNSGRTTGTHLHFEIRKNGEPLDPRILFPGFKGN